MNTSRGLLSIARMRTSLRRLHSLFHFASILFAALASSSAEIRLPGAITDHAVLERGVPIHLWGWATPEAQLTVNLKQQAVVTSADQLGEWEVWLMPEAAGVPYTLTVQSDAKEGRKNVSDLWIGDVWIASGQSNMDIPLKGYPGAPIKNGPTEIAAATVPMLRILHVGQVSSDHPLDDIRDKWTLCTSETAADTSAVAYFFGREIAEREKVPVRLIVAAWGGVPVDSYISLEGLAANLAGLAALCSRASFADGLTRQEGLKGVEGREDAAARGRWNSCSVALLAPRWPFLGSGGALQRDDCAIDQVFDQGISLVPGGNRHPSRPGTELPGALRDPHRRLEKPLCTGRPALPLCADFQLQLPPRLGYGTRCATPHSLVAQYGDGGHARCWRSIEHPSCRQTDRRRASRPCGEEYGLRRRHPLQVAALPPGDSAIGKDACLFDNAIGLTVRARNLEGFEVAGADHQFLPAKAVVDGETIVAGNTSIRSPMYVRYAWAGVAPPGLYNSDLLPAGTFTSEAAPEY